MRLKQDEILMLALILSGCEQDANIDYDKREFLRLTLRDSLSKKHRDEFNRIVYGESTEVSKAANKMWT